MVYSSFFRRLAGVTQVVSASEGNIFHNRLIHSLKVAQVGRSLAEHLIRTTQPELIEAVGGIDADVVETACLAHDLGHPPFGHIAESELDDCAKKEKVSDGFEGNPQSFRIVTRVAIRDSSHPGLNLTSASLNALLKYPWPRATAGKESEKWGYYHSDNEDFEWARARDKNSQQRSADADIMDWADDIAYSIHDVDDLYRAGLVPLDRILTGGGETDRFLEAMNRRGVIRDSEIAADLFKQLRDFVVQKEIMMPFEGTSAQYQALRRFERFLTRRFLGLNEPEMLRLSADGATPRLAVTPRLRKEVNILKGLMQFYVYGAPALVAQQYGQRQIIKGLFKIFRDAAKDKKPATPRIFPPLYDERLQANANISRNTDILASERSERQSSGRCEHGPAQHATGADAYVQTHGVEGTRVGFAFLRCVGSEEAPHRLVTDNDEADTRVDLAREPTHLRPRLRSLGRRWHGKHRHQRE